MKVSREIFEVSNEEGLRAFIRERKARFNWFRRVIVYPDQTRIVDINRNELVFPGITYEHHFLELVMKEAGASYDLATLHTRPKTSGGTREHPCGACYPWAHDRIS